MGAFFVYNNREMNTKTFTQKVRALRAVPEDLKQSFLTMATDLPAAEQEIILAQLQALNAELEKAEQKYAASLQRGKAMVEQVKEHDVPAFLALQQDA